VKIPKPPGARLVNPDCTRAALTIQMAKNNSRSVSTMVKRRAEATRFVQYMYDKKRDLVSGAMVGKLIVAEESTTYRTENMRGLALRNIIGVDYESKAYDIIIFRDVTADAIGNYLCDRCRQDGGLQRGKAYRNNQCAVAMFFFRILVTNGKNNLPMMLVILFKGFAAPLVEQNRIGKEILKKVKEI
jgi:hypothetical protein